MIYSESLFFINYNMLCNFIFKKILFLERGIRKDMKHRNLTVELTLKMCQYVLNLSKLEQYWLINAQSYTLPKFFSNFCFILAF